MSGAIPEEEWPDSAPDDEEPRRRIVLVAADGMRLRAPRWLFDRRMPTDAISLLAGREGIGKSTIAFDIVARVTRGTLPGRFCGTPRNVGVIASEDSWESVILPRLIAARADLDRVFRVEVKDEEGRIGTISTPVDLEDLARVVAERDIVLLIVDPIMSIVDGRIDTHKDREVRRALEPLARFCATHNVAVLALIHVNKSGSTDPLNSLMASRAFTAVARSVLYCVVDPDAGGEERFLFGHPKSNLGTKQPTLKYRLIDCKVPIPDAEDPRDKVMSIARVVWEGEDSRSIRDVLESLGRERPKGEVSHRILEWLRRHGCAASLAEIAAALPDVERNTLEQNLTRMVKRGDAVRPLRGMYALPPNIVPDGVLTPSEASVVSEPSGTQGQLTQLTDLTLRHASGTASETRAGCGRCGFDLNSNGHAVNCLEAA